MNELHRLIRFGMVGMIATIAYVTLATLLAIAGLRPGLASLSSHFTVAIPTFFGHRFITFRQTGRPRISEAMSFAVSQIAGSSVAALTAEAIHGLGINPKTAIPYIFAAASGATVSFLVMRLHTFRAQPSS